MKFWGLEVGIVFVALAAALHGWNPSSDAGMAWSAPDKAASFRPVDIERHDHRAPPPKPQHQSAAAGVAFGLY